MSLPQDISPFFKSLYDNARSNSVLLMDADGIILDANRAFTINFGYSIEDIEGHHCRLLFTPEDRARKIPELEIMGVKAENTFMDNNYLLHKEGQPVWVTGESILVKTEPQSYILKIIHNIHTLKLLETFLIQSDRFIETMFESLLDIGLLVADNRLRVIKVNEGFLKMFGITEEISGMRLADLEHPFWRNKAVIDALRGDMIKNHFNKTVEFTISGTNNMSEQYKIFTKQMDEVGEVKKILFIVQRIPL